MNPGILYAALAYSLWGLFPLYFKHLQHVGAAEVVMHRTVWSLAFVLVLLVALRRWAWLPAVLRQPKVLGTFAMSAAFLACNWGVYIWAVSHDHVLDASLGYFILPLINVAFGFVFLHERLRALQWLAVVLAALGVLWLTVQAGHPPWVALAMAISFAIYGLLRKMAPLGALEGLALETMLMAPVALLGLLWLARTSPATFAASDPSTLVWLAWSGPVTAVPLLLFAAGARRIPMSMLGMLQYIAPTILLGLGVWLYGEPFGGPCVVGFVLIWAALVVYTAEGWWRSRQPALQDIPSV